MIKVEFTIKYYESYIPPRCRKPRYNEVTESVFGNLREVAMTDVKLAFGIDFVDKFNDDFSDNDFNSLNEEIERVINKIDNFLNKHNL